MDVDNRRVCLSRKSEKEGLESQSLQLISLNSGAAEIYKRVAAMCVWF